MHMVPSCAGSCGGLRRDCFICVKLSTLEFLINIIQSANPSLGSGRYSGERRDGLPGGDKNKDQADVEGIQARLNRDETCSAIVI